MIKSKPSEASQIARVTTALALFLAGLLVWSGLMIERALWLRGLGPICGHRGLLLTVHCPGCYVAAAMMIGALAVLATTMKEAKPAARVRVGSAQRGPRHASDGAHSAR